MREATPMFGTSRQRKVAVVFTATLLFAAACVASPAARHGSGPGHPGDCRGRYHAAGHGHNHDGHDDGPIAIPDDGIQSSVWDDGTVSLAIELEADDEVHAVRVKELEIKRSSYLGPNPLPFVVGEIDPDAPAVVDAQFNGRNLAAGHTSKLEMSGTFRIGRKTCKWDADAKFTPTAPSDAPVETHETAAAKQTARTATFPPDLDPPHPDEGFNEFEQIRVPQGQPRNLFPTSPAASALDSAAGFAPDDQAPPSGSDGNAVVFTRNAKGKGNDSGIPPDPSVAGADGTGFAMISSNSDVAYSTDYGSSFTEQALVSGFVDPAIPSRTSFFPQDDGGLCCDQVLHYIPSRNIYVWLLQYRSTQSTTGGVTTTGQNRLRIAWATPEAAKADFLHAWTWADLTAGLYGLAATDWMDYPDLAYSNDFLYVSVDHGFVNSANKQKIYGARRIFTRMSLSDMVGPGSSVGLRFGEPTKNGLAKNHMAQSSPNAMYFSAQPDTSKLVVYSWPDSSTTIGSRTLNISSWKNDTTAVNDPDSLNWNVAPLGALGAAVTDPAIPCPVCTQPPRFIYFAMSTGSDTGNGRAFPYVRVEKVLTLSLRQTVSS